MRVGKGGGGEVDERTNRRNEERGGSAQRSQGDGFGPLRDVTFKTRPHDSPQISRESRSQQPRMRQPFQQQGYTGSRGRSTPSARSTHIACSGSGGSTTPCDPARGGIVRREGIVPKREGIVPQFRQQGKHQEERHGRGDGRATIPQSVTPR